MTISPVIHDYIETLERSQDPLVRLRAIRGIARWLRDLESEATTKARESGATWAEIGASQDRPRQAVHRQASKTPHRPRVEGLTLAEYRHVGTSDLRHWLEWWSEPERSPEGREEKGRDPEEEKRKLRAEIEARERLGVAGPDRDRVW